MSKLLLFNLAQDPQFTPGTQENLKINALLIVMIPFWPRRGNLGKPLDSVYFYKTRF